MIIHARTLEELTHVLEEKGIVLIAEIDFIRAPYRHHNHWVCRVESPRLP